jgi:hypothetical protein
MRLASVERQDYTSGNKHVSNEKNLWDDQGGAENDMEKEISMEAGQMWSGGDGKVQGGRE